MSDTHPAELVVQLKRAIDSNSVEVVKRLMTTNPELHRAPLGYANDGPLTWVAECRIPREPPSATRLDLAKWMIENGSDVHQGGDGALMRAALDNSRISMMELLVSHGANVNAVWHGSFPIIFAPCETLDPTSLKWLLDKGADPNNHQQNATALDYVIGSYVRAPERLAACIDVLFAAGGITRYNEPAILSILAGRLDQLRELLDADSTLVRRTFPELAFGTTGTRMLTLEGGTLLHVAAEYGNLDAAQLLVVRGADVNHKAAVQRSGLGGQTAIFHAATQFDDDGLPLTCFLIEQGADLSIRAKLPGHYERPGEEVICTPLEYANMFPGGDSETVALLRTNT